MATQTDKYFKDYEDILVHELMLKDKPRVTAYKMFIENNSDVFQNKIVVDVGAGTGILSLLVAKAGAKHVSYKAIDNIFTNMISCIILYFQQIEELSQIKVDMCESRKVKVERLTVIGGFNEISIFNSNEIFWLTKSKNI